MIYSDISTAFEILLEEIENEIIKLNYEAQEALKNKEFEKTEKIIERMKKIMEFKEKITVLQKEWNDIFVERPIVKYVEKKEQKKLKKGLRTPEHEFRIPILEALVELGGKGTLKEVLSKVEKNEK